MLCTSCQHKPTCLAAQLAQGDAALAVMLGQLKRCGLQRRSISQRLWAWVRAQWHRLRTMLAA